VNSKPDFKITILFNVKKLENGTNRKSHIVYRTASFSVTLNDPNLVFKVTAFFDTEYLTNGYRYGHSYYRRRIETAPKLSNVTSFNDIE